MKKKLKDQLKDCQEDLKDDEAYLKQLESKQQSFKLETDNETFHSIFLALVIK